jgi:hypothetical protein
VKIKVFVDLPSTPYAPLLLDGVHEASRWEWSSDGGLRIFLDDKLVHEYDHAVAVSKVGE